MLLSKINTPKAVFLNQQKHKNLTIIIEENIRITNLINVKIIIKMAKDRQYVLNSFSFILITVLLKPPVHNEIK